MSARSRSRGMDALAGLAGTAWLPRARPGLGLVGPWLRAALVEEADRRRLFPWIAVAFGCGILCAFASDGPVSIWPPLAAGFAAAGGAVACRTRPVGFAVFVAVGALFFGFAAAAFRMRTVEAPVLQRLTVTTIEGFVEIVEERGTGRRLVVRLNGAAKLTSAERPPRVRVTIRGKDPVAPGDYVTATARLMPLPEAARPGGYDFARDAYFRGIGAVGSVSGRLKVVPPPAEPDAWLRLVAAIDRARNALTARIAGTIGGQAGATAAALVTGKRGLIDEHSNDILRAAGIYHIVSISGLHMVLAAGAFFWITRALLALSAPLALGWPIKKIAALAGMIGATAYNVFSGSDVATERSLAMILVMQGSILVDRPALSLRNLALSALTVLAFEPEALLGPSLQMSYAAVAGLIAMAEWNRGRTRSEPGGWLQRSLAWMTAAVVGTVTTTLVASVATGPFSSYHFQNLQPYGVLGNAVTLPLVSLVVMPCAVLGTVALPFGLDRPVWAIMGYAVQGVLTLSEWVAGLSGSIVVVPAFGPGALGLCAVALLLTVLPAARLRVFACLPLAGAIAATTFATRPDIFVARDGSGVAVRGPNGKLAVAGRTASFTVEQWLKADGDNRKPGDLTLSGDVRCDTLGCTLPMPNNRRVAWVENRSAFAEDCRRAALIVSRLVAPTDCSATLVLDRDRLAESGAVSVELRSGEWRVQTARQRNTTAPWQVRPPERRPATPTERAEPVPLPDPPSPADDPDQ